MAEYNKKPDNTGWYSWPVIIILFALGLYPIALVLMFVNIFGLGSKKKSTRTRPSAESRMEQAVEDAVERAVERAKHTASGARPTAAQEAMEKRRAAAAQQRMQEAEARVAEAEKRVKEAQSRAYAAKKKQEYAPAAAQKARAEQKKKQKLPGKLLRVLGICLLAIGMIATLDSAAHILQGWSYYLENLFAGLGFLLSGGIMWGRGQYLAQMTRRSQRYILAIGNVDAMPLSEIAKRVNRTPDKAAKELQKLIDKGYLGEDAYIDHEKGWFLRFGASVEEPKTVEEPVEQSEESYEVILRNIRRANDRIDDEELSRKIDRLENISRLIFREVEAHPEKRGRIHTFFDYYLPTTQKLLDAYADFEETGVQGEHLSEAKERIEQTMDAIVEGFEHQLDQLYSSDAMDVVSDIKVMESMLQRDTASAAKDFGYAKAKKEKDKPDEGITLEL